MIATCKFCQLLIHPLAILPMKPAQLAKIPPEQLEVMKFSAGVTEHMRKEHKEYVEYVQALSGSFTGHCLLSAVDVAGDNHKLFEVFRAHDDAMVRAQWEAVPNPPHPDVVQQIQDEARAALALVNAQAGEDGRGHIEPDNTYPLTPPPPGKIKLN